MPARLRRFLLSTGQGGSVKTAGMRTPDLADRLSAAREAKKALLERAKAIAENPERAERRKARQEVVAARNARLAERKAAEEEARRREAAERAAREAAEAAIREAQRQAERRDPRQAARRGGGPAGRRGSRARGHSGRPPRRAKSPQAEGQALAQDRRQIGIVRPASLPADLPSRRCRRVSVADQAREVKRSTLDRSAGARLSAHLLRDVDQRAAPQRRTGRTPPSPRR